MRIILSALLTAAAFGCTPQMAEPPTATLTGLVITPEPAPDQVVVFLEPETPGTATAGRRPRSASMTIGGRGEFDVTTAAAEEGGGLTIRNSDSRTWNVSSPSPAAKFDSGALAPGGLTSVALLGNGPVDIVARAGNDEIRAVVFVVPGRLFTLVPPRGTYRIDEIPPGRYRVAGWARDMFARAPVAYMNLGAGEPVRQDLILRAVRKP